MSRVLKSVIALLFLGGLIAGGIWIARSITWPLTVAVPPLGDTTSKMLQALGREASQSSHWVRMKRISVADMPAAAAALQDGKVDLAILRTDVGLPSKAQTIAILRTYQVFLIIPPNSSIESFSNLRNRTIGFLPGPPEDQALLDKILTYNNIPTASVNRLQLTPAEAGVALGQKKIAAIYVVGIPGIGISSEAYAAAAKATKGTPQIIGVDEADAMVKHFGGLQKVDIDAGSFGGVKAQPEEDTATLAVTLRLVAKQSMSNYVVGEVARKLLEAKTRLASTEPSVMGIEAPDTDDTQFAIHPGAKAYFDGDAPSLFDRFESLFWIGSAALGILGSGLTWLWSRIRGPRQDMEPVGDRLASFLKRVRQADERALAELEDELDSIVLQLIEARSEGTIEGDDINTYAIAVLHGRAAIAERLAFLRQQQGQGME